MSTLLRTRSHRRRVRMLAGGGAVEEGPWWDPGNEGLSVKAAYQPVGAASFADSLLDRSGNGNDGILMVGTPSWNETDGWNHWVIFSVAAGVTAVDGRNQTMIIQFSDGDPENGYLCGAKLFTGNCYLRILSGLPGWVHYAHGNNQPVSNPITSGNLGFAGGNAFCNGVFESAIAPGGSSATSGLTIGSVLNGGNGKFKTRAWVFYDEIISDESFGVVATAMAAL